MDREIKFRVWIEEEKAMIDVPIIDFREKGKIKTTYSSPCGEWEYNFDEIELMQFTGLYDKNKVPIYEGDILNFDDEYWVISFEYGKFIATFDNVCEDLHEVSHYEVIGNIHENSNLIGDVNGN